MRELNTQGRILVEAQDLIQRFGYFGLSLQDLADRIEIRKPSLYAHYDSKESLGVSLLRDYTLQFKAWAERLQGESPDSKLHEFLNGLERQLNLGKVSATAALSLDGPRLPESMRQAHLEFLNVEAEWLQGVIAEGQERKHYLNSMSAKTLAQMLIQQMVGAQMLARLTNDLNWFHQASAEILKLIRGGAPVQPVQAVVPEAPKAILGL